MTSYFNFVLVGPDQQYAVVVTSGFCGVGVLVGAPIVFVARMDVVDLVGR